MRIPCPFCGLRDAQEYSYLGDATLRRPVPDAPDAERAFVDYVYPRANPAGSHREYWRHSAGCHGWLIVTRDTLTHAILGSEFADPHLGEEA